MKSIKMQIVELNNSEIQDKKVEFNKLINLLKKCQNEIKLKIKKKNPGSQIKGSEESITNRLKGMEERISGIQDKIELDSKVKNC